MEIKDLEVQTLNINRIKKLFYIKTNKRFFLKKNIFNKYLNNINNYPNIKKCLDNIFIDSDSYLETLYRLLHNIKYKPICPICGNKIPLTIKCKIFFPKTCSKKCSYILTTQNTKKNCLLKYGVDNPAKSELIKEKSKQTCLEKYGKEYYYQSNEFKEKSKQTCLKKYNKEYVLQIEHIHKKGILAAQTQRAKEKRKNTTFKKYGVYNISQNDEIKLKKEQTCLKHYGVKNGFNIDYVKNKCNSPESHKKMYETKKKNNSFNKSIWEDKCYILLKEKYPDVLRQYRSELYPFNCDFYIPSLDLYIECNFLWTHGFHPYNKNNIEDQNKLNIWKSKNTEYYKNAIYTWTDLDIRKRNIVKENKLNYIEFWNINELKNWLTKNEEA